MRLLLFKESSKSYQNFLWIAHAKALHILTRPINILDRSFNKLTFFTEIKLSVSLSLFIIWRIFFLCARKIFLWKYFEYAYVSIVTYSMILPWFQYYCHTKKKYANNTTLVSYCTKLHRSFQKRNCFFFCILWLMSIHILCIFMWMCYISQWPILWANKSIVNYLHTK